MEIFFAQKWRFPFSQGKTPHHPQVSCVVRKPVFGICENKGAVQLHSNFTAVQHLCFCYIDSTISFSFYLYPKFQASTHLLWLNSPVCVGPAWSETPKTGYLITQLKQNLACLTCAISQTQIQGSAIMKQLKQFFCQIL